jgi:lipoprotein-anchoring transpeptidase ErfK/SrfK
MGNPHSRIGEHLYFFLCVMSTTLLICGCSLANEELQMANDFFRQGSYDASMRKYGQIVQKYPVAADRALFEMGIIYAHSGYDQKNYRKSLECFQKLIDDYPQSWYRRDSEVMIFHIGNLAAKDMKLAEKQQEIESLREVVRSMGDDAITQQKKIESLEREIKSKEHEIVAMQKEVFSLRGGPVDKILVEKKKRRLLLISKGEVLKTYKIALGGNPVGPKERAGDNKTPEGTYIIDSRKKNSGYHLALHISYPNEKDKKRAKKLGFSPGGDIMIHGIKNGFSWAVDYYTEVDWTKGCIAVTDEEIEEIANLVPNGTTVEIRP